MKHKKYIVIGVIVLAFMLIISALSNSTYALFSSDDYGANPNVYTTGNLSIEAKSKSEVISLNNALPMSDKDGMESTPYVFTIKNTGTVNYKFNVKLLSTGDGSTSFSSNYIKLQIDDGDVNILSGLTNSMIKQDVVLGAGETIDISIRIWLDEETPNSEIGKSFNSKIVIDGQSVSVSKKNTFVDYISNLYTPNDTAENNGITYNLDTTHSLMNDRLGSMTVAADSGNIRYYGASPNNYIDIGDVYKEDTVVNNWEEFGIQGLFTESSECYNFLSYENMKNIGACEDDESCEIALSSMLQSMGVSSVDEVCGTTVIQAGTPKLYRIIGLFKDVELADGTKKDLIKVVREDAIGMYSWDTSSSDVNDGFGVNEWSQADLMKLLNPNYSTNTDTICDFDQSSNSTSCTNVRTGLVNNSLWWNSGSGLCYRWKSNGTVSCDFTNIGLNSEVHNRIEEVYWNLGGLDGREEYLNQIYEYERLDNLVIPGTTCTGGLCNDSVTRKAKWKGHVGLMYPSDYGYGTDLKLCQETLYNYGSESCDQNDWLYNNSYQWLLTPDSSNANDAWGVNDDGYVSYYNVYYSAGVSPVFYLDSGLGIVTGDGSEDKPFVVR